MVTPPVVAIASTLAGEPVTVSCEKDARFSTLLRAYTLYVRSDDGAVVFDPVIHLAASTCNALNRLVVRDGRQHVARQQIITNGGAITDVEDGGAVHLLLHEALHLRLESADEALVEHETQLNRWSALKLFKLAAWRDHQILRGMTLWHCASSRTPVDYLALGAC